MAQVKNSMSEKRFWLMKSEPSVFSIGDLSRAKNQVSGWDGVRNYQARNYIKEMKPGEGVLFYHSNAEPPGIVGIAEIVRAAYPDPTQFEPKNIHYDPKSKKEAPIWFQVDVRFVKAFKGLLALEDLRRSPALSSMALFKLSRLSVQPVTKAQWDKILKLASA